MAIRIKIPRGRSGSRFRLNDPVVRGAVAAFIVLCTVFFGVFAYYYVRYQNLVDRRMRGQIFENVAKVYGRPDVLRAGRKASKEDLAAQLRRAGYTEAGERGESLLGTYRLRPDGIEVRPGPESFHAAEGAFVKIRGGKVEAIHSLDNGSRLSAFELEPQLLTGLFSGEQRTKRRLIKFDDLPQHLVDAVLAIEDRRFFDHSGINYLRFAQAVWIDLREGRLAQGGSTITMQVSRGFFLTPEKSPKRKLAEMLIAMELEQRYSKKQIFEFYANYVPMGQRGSFEIRGLGEAAKAYFDKDVRDLSLEESALLAGIIQRPSYLSPFRHPQRAMERRNLVLHSMVEFGKLSRDDAERAKAMPLKLAPANVEASDAPYFVDMVRTSLLNRYSDEDLSGQGYRIYTTLDPELQAAAAEAVEVGMKLVDEQVQKQRTRKVRVGKGKNAKTETKILDGPTPQVALVALDPKTGEVLALLGGRNYGMSQLNRALAKRPTGSIFKPFVFAAAMNTALGGSDMVYTPASLIEDAPTTFAYEDKVYEPRNYKGEYHGAVTARYALALSLNNATVRLAEQVGFDRVAELARAAGIRNVRATPAMALGAYDATPLEMAGAYTVFANSGVRSTPLMIRSLRDAKGDVIEEFASDKRPVLDPRVAYVLTDMMEAVINNGTGTPVRARGFSARAAGKTGSSHDAWFAGYTSNLLCIVWVGYDDYSDLKLSGGSTAAPIWAEFMKRAIELPQYANPKPFPQPSGVVDVTLDRATNLLANSSCTDTYSIAFIAGTEPTQTCDQAGGGRNIFSRIFGIGGGSDQPKPAAAVPNQQARPGAASSQQAATSSQPEQKQEKKKGFFGRIFGVFKGDGDSDDKKKSPPPQQPPQTPR